MSFWNALDTSLWTSLRTLQDQEAVMRRLAEKCNGAEADEATRQADGLAAAAATLRCIVEQKPLPPASM